MKELSKIKKVLKMKGFKTEFIERVIDNSNGYRVFYYVYTDKFEDYLVLSDWSKKQFDESSKNNLFDISIQKQIDRMINDYYRFNNIEREVI